MHHYKVAQDAIDKAVNEATQHGWSESELLQSVLVTAIERYAKLQGKQDTEQLLTFEISNIRDTVDYDFVRSR